MQDLDRSGRGPNGPGLGGAPGSRSGQGSGGGLGPGTDGGPGGGAGPTAPPRVPRKRRRGMFLLSVLLVGAGALIATYLVDSLSDRVAVVVLARDVPVGTQLARDHLDTAKVSVEPAVKTIPARQIDEVVGQIARVDLAKGTMLASAQLTAEPTPGQGQQVVSAPLKQSRIPARGLRPGVPVLIVGAPGGGQGPPPSTGQSGGAATLPNTAATVDQIGEPDADGLVVVDLLVPEAVGPAVAKEAADGRIALILTPRRP